MICNLISNPKLALICCIFCEMLQLFPRPTVRCWPYSTGHQTCGYFLFFFFKYLVASLLQCCSGVCQSGDRGGAGICTQCGSLGLNHAITSNWVCCRSFQSVIHLFIVTLYKCSWQWLAKCCVGLHLVSSCHGVQMPADPPIATLANATLA